MTQQTAACLVIHLDPAEVAAIYPGNAVVAGEPFVQERVVSRQQVEHVPVASDLRLEKEGRFGGHCRLGVFVELHEPLGVRDVALDVADGEPLLHEVGHPAGGTWVGQQAVGLLGQHGRVAQPTRFSPLE